MRIRIAGLLDPSELTGLAFDSATWMGAAGVLGTGVEGIGAGVGGIMIPFSAASALSLWLWPL